MCSLCLFPVRGALQGHVWIHESLHYPDRGTGGGGANKQAEGLHDTTGPVPPWWRDHPALNVPHALPAAAGAAVNTQGHCQPRHCQPSRTADARLR